MINIYTSNFTYGLYSKNSDNIINFNSKRNTNKTKKASISFKGSNVQELEQNDLSSSILRYMTGMKNRLITILEQEGLLTIKDIEKITKAFDEEINPNSTTMQHMLEDIEFMKSTSKLLNNSDDPKMILAQDTVPVRFYYEVAHKLYNNNEQALGMQVAKKSTQITGAQIYPGAKIEPGVMFSHGIGVVIGNTAHVGAKSTIYQNVTLGRRSGPNAMQANRDFRHPQVENGTTIGAGAILLGPIIIKDNAKVGAGAIVTHDMPEGSVARYKASDIYPAIS
ncbi:MAG: hypothetical protein IKU37_03300 [Candidatus Gastranaerophilales bacterium]|nr:hypothetical protein [Candidatus Gastranaerophilales bacterium]